MAAPEASGGRRGAQRMVQAVVQLTVLMVAILAATNMLQAVWLLVRLGRHAAGSHPGLGFRLWLPIFQSPRDVREWWAAWRSILTSGDPLVVAMRLEARTVLTRHLHLMVTSNAWGMAVSVLAPSLS